MINLADSFWGFLYQSTLQKYWRPAWKLPFIQKPSAYVTGLPIILEGQTGGGWDVCLHDPGLNGNERAVFIQFKAGVHIEYCQDKKSIFYGHHKSTLNPHVLFEFNNNNNLNQHKLLQDLEKAKSKQGHPVLYAFPRIVNDNQIKLNAGKLLTKTSFISISDLDAKAKANNVSIDVGEAHKFRACYNDYRKSEVNFFFFFYNEPDRTPDFIGEIVAITVMRALRSMKQQTQVLDQIPIRYLTNSFIQFVRFLQEYFGVVEREDNKLLHHSGYNFQKSYRDFMTLNKKHETIWPETGGTKREFDIYNAIITDLIPYLNLCDSDIIQEINVPEAPDKFTFGFDNGDIRIPMDDEIAGEDYMGISYSIF